MECRRFGRFMGIVLTAGLLGISGAGLAGQEQGAHHEMLAKGRPVAGADTLGGLWQTVKARESELSDLIKAKDLGKVHEVAFAIRDVVAQMPEKSGQLPADQQAKLRGNAKYVATLAERLDKAGDAKDQTATEASFKQLQSVLGAIEALYPPDALR